MSFLRRAWAEIDIAAIVDNYKIIKEHTGKPVYAVVKADAYGHGAAAVAPRLEAAGADGFAVSNIEEADQLRECGIRTPILILGYTPPECARRLAEGGISQCVYSLEYATELACQAEAAGVCVDIHIKIDTGMGRIGFDCRTEHTKALEQICSVYKMPSLHTGGIFTHFACADSTDAEDARFSELQHERFFGIVHTLEQMGCSFPFVHCANSAFSLGAFGQKGDILRAGIIMYGLAPSDTTKLPDGMRAAMSFYSVVSMVKRVEPGESISYGRTYTASEPRIIATVSAGYADGVPRLLSNRGEVIIRGKRAPIVGRVCMDQFCVDVTDIEGVSMGERVTIFGGELSADEVARHAETINYEIICGVSKRTVRIFKN